MRRARDSRTPRKAPKVYAKIIRTNSTKLAALKAMPIYTPRVTIGLKCPPEMAANILYTT